MENNKKQYSKEFISKTILSLNNQVLLLKHKRSLLNKEINILNSQVVSWELVDLNQTKMPFT